MFNHTKFKPWTSLTVFTKWDTLSPMRILIFSDLHANLEALRALQSAERQPDALLFLGDAVGYGPDPAACVAWLRGNITYAVQGNHDHAIVTGSAFTSPPEYIDLARASRAHALRQLSAADIS
jgi:predicted phosphodiesterase